MNKLGRVMRELHRAENALAADLLAMAQRHRGEHEVFHVATDIAVWSHEHVRAIAAVAPGYGLELDPDPAAPAPADPLREPGELWGTASEPGMALLADLRTFHRDAAGVSLDWELLGQAAQALQARDLLQLTQRCHPQTVRQMQWADGQLKTSAPQVLSS